MNASPDAPERAAALQCDRSFIVKAPAGSGKTGLLVRRYIALLATVDEPEEVLAITFTRKATSEMRARVMDALRLGGGPEPKDEHERDLWLLAKDLLARDASRGWRLVEQPSRLAIQTMDALAAGLARQLPWLSGLGGALSVNESTTDAYEEASRRVIDGIAGDDVRIAGAVSTLVQHLDGDRNRAQALIATMLARREQWRDLLPAHGDEAQWRVQLEQAARLLVEMLIDDVAAQVPRTCHDDIVRLASYAAANLKAAGIESPVLSWLEVDTFPKPCVENLPQWRALADFLLTGNDDLRKQVDKRNGFPAQGAGAGDRKEQMKALLAELADSSSLGRALAAARYLPEPEYSDAQWSVLEALAFLLKLAAAELRVRFATDARTDFCELTIGACDALGSELAPSDLALALDRRIRHVLVDEFQDTSISHSHLIGQLVAGFDGNDGRTLFVVGDPMQSIYRFREAEVALFLNLWANRGAGFPGFPVTPLALSANFRSRPALVQWVNRTFEKILPGEDDSFRGATAFASAQAARESSSAAGVHVHPLLLASDEEEAAEVERTLAAARSAKPDASIAILGRSRRHLTAIVRYLRESGYVVRGSDLEPLSGAQSVQDLIALARAIAHPLDRAAGLSVLRAPWCGLELGDLHGLGGDSPNGSIAELLQDDAILQGMSEEGQVRAGRVAEVLAAARNSHAREPFSKRVRRAWLALGGPVIVHDVSCEDIERVFDKLRGLDDGAAGARFDELEVELDRLYVSPQASSPDAIDVMTMHKAKGLEFDVVILPGLHKGTGTDSAPLLAWTRLGDRDPGLVIAPVPKYDGDGEPLFRSLRRFERQRSNAEAARLLYVACTRARESLSLVASVGVSYDDDGKPCPTPPTSNTLLSWLWPAVHQDFDDLFEVSEPEPSAISTTASSHDRVLKRLPLGWRPPAGPVHSGVPTVDAFEVEQFEPVEYTWARREARHIGTAVHYWLQRIAQDGVDAWSAERIAALEPLLRSELRELGVTPDVLPGAAGRALDALQGTIVDDRGRWILDEHHLESRNELAITADLDGELLSVAIDRTFVENTPQGEVRWIIDYKTGAHSGGGVEGFLDREQERYRPQLERYARILAVADPRPIRLGLYFPLLLGWRAWTHKMLE